MKVIEPSCVLADEDGMGVPYGLKINYNCMKKKIYLIWTVCCAMLASCDSQLDKMGPHNQPDADTYLEDFDNVVKATSGVYSQFYMQGGGFQDLAPYDLAMHTLGELRGNNVILAEAFTPKMDDELVFRYSDAHFFINTDRKRESMAWPVWAKTHQIVLSASQIIKALDKLYPQTLNPEQKEKLLQLKGDNLFIRGLAIFNGVNCFGRPYWDEPEKNLGIPLDVNGSGNLLPRSSVKAGFEQALADFKAAVRYLPENGTFDRTYANRAAAYGMISKVYLYMGGLPESPDRENNRLAALYADSVFMQPGVELCTGTDFEQLYLSDARVNKEFLFAFSPANFAGNIGNPIRKLYNWTGIESQKNTAIYEVVVSRDFEKLMDKEKDIRWKFFVTASERHPGRFTTCKYDGGKQYSYGDNAYFQAPDILIRAGEVALNRAEAYAKMGDARAIADLNDIRTRAGLDRVNGLSGAELWKAVFTERQRELAFEGQVFFDYARNGVTIQREEITTAYPLYTGDQYNRLDTKTSRRTMLKIPYEELQLNKKLVQNEY